MTETVQTRIDDCSCELDEIEKLINNLSAFDKTRQYLTNYALIRASGTLESAYHHIVADYLEQFEIPQFNYYIARNVRRNSSSVEYDNMVKFLGMFDENWKKAFKQSVSARTESEKLRVSAKSLVDNRHAFAHGSNVTISIKDVKSYFYDTLELIKEFDNAVR